MPVSFAAATTIAAAPEKVWALVTDVSSYATWNPTIVKIEGVVALGQKIRLVSAVDPQRTFVLRVTTFEAPDRMVWSGGMPLGLFVGRRTFNLSRRSDGGTDFEMSEAFTGPLAGIITKAIPDMTESFAAFADALKAAAEA